MADVKNICGYDVKDASARNACSSLDTRVTALEQGGSADLSVIAPIESGSTASQAYAQGEQMIFNDVLYKAISAIAQGDTLDSGSSGNIETSGDVVSQLADMRSDFQDGVDVIYNAEVAQGVSGVPTASTPTALANGVGAIATAKYTEGYNAGTTNAESKTWIDYFQVLHNFGISGSVTPGILVGLSDVQSIKLIQAGYGTITCQWRSNKDTSISSFTPTLNTSYNVPSNATYLNVTQGISSGRSGGATFEAIRQGKQLKTVTW